MRINDLHRYKSINCSCGDGIKYPNKFAYNLLEQLEIDFISEYSPEWCFVYFKKEDRKCRYDFYFELKNNKYILEMDGGWHKKDNKMSGQTASDSKYIDNIKDRLASEHNIEVIRIDCKISELNYIKNNILNSNIQELFDLSKIDWDKVEEFALSNRVKEACDIWNKHPEYSTLDIANVMNINRATVIRYLKQGSKIGWCGYDAEKENIKRGIELGKMHLKPVEIFKDGISLGIFESVSELSRQSEELFEVKLNLTSISTASNKLKQYKGFTFKYINSITVTTAGNSMNKLT